MKKLLSIFFIIILFLVFIAWNNSNPKIIINRLANKVDIRIEELRYKVYLFSVLPVGDASLADRETEDYKGQKVYHLRASARSLRFFSRFFSGSAVLDSYIDIQQLNPILFKQRILISGKPDMNKEVIYDQKNGIMSIGTVKRQILSNTQDPLSAVFNLRHIDFDKIKAFEMNLNTNQKNYILKSTARKQDISVNNKTYKIVLVKGDIARRDKNPYHKSSIRIVLLNKEKENIPILIKVFANGFFITARLIDIK